MANLENEVLPGCKAKEFFCLKDRCGHRFFDENVQPSFKSLTGDVVMKDCGDHHAHCVGPGVFKKTIKVGIIGNTQSFSYG
jgi:hypothetical protein